MRARQPERGVSYQLARGECCGKEQPVPLACLNGGHRRAHCCAHGQEEDHCGFTGWRPATGHAVGGDTDCTGKRPHGSTAHPRKHRDP